MTKAILLNVAKYGLGIVLLGYVVSKYWTPPPGSAGPGLAEAFQRPVMLTPLLLSVACCASGLFLTHVRWYVLVRAQGLPFRFTDALRLGMIGYFLSAFLPGSVSGDLVKIVFLAKEQARRTVAISTVLIDRAVGLWGLFWLVTLAGGGFWLLGDPTVSRQPAIGSILGSSALLIGGSVCCLLVMELLPEARAKRFAERLEGMPKVGHSAAELWRAVWMYHTQRLMVATALLLAVVGHIGFVLTFYFAAQIFQTPEGLADLPSLGQHFVIVPVGMTIQAFFPAPGGVGGGEAAFAGLYKLLGAPEASGILASLGQRIVGWGLALTGYVVALRMSASPRPAAIDTPSAEAGPEPVVAPEPAANVA